MKKRKFNIFDLVIILAVIVLAVGICYKFFVIGDAAPSVEETETVPVTFTVELETQRQYVVDILKQGDTVYLSENTEEGDSVDGSKLISTDKESFGTITDITVTPSREAFVKTDGTIGNATYQDRYNILLTIAGEGQVIDDVVQIDGYNLMVNKSFAFFTQYYGANARIRSVTVSQS